MTSRLGLFKREIGATKPKLPPEQIAALTFHLYLKEGGPEGKEIEIWRRAKKMLREQLGQKKSADGGTEPQRGPVARAGWFDFAM